MTEEVVSIESAPIKRFISQSMAAIPAKDHREFKSVLSNFYLSMNDSEKFNFNNLVSRMKTKKDICSYARSMYEMFKNKGA
jgi:hypothetical protein